MLKVIMLQVVAVLAAAAMSGLLVEPGSTKSAVLSAIAGGAAYLLPNLVFVLRLRVATAMHQASVAGFLVGEAVKLSAVIALLVVLPRMIVVHWPAFLAGLFVVLFVNLFALLLKT